MFQLFKAQFYLTALRCGVLVAVLVHVSDGRSQSIVKVQHGEDVFPVVAMDGENPIVQVGSERVYVYDGRITVEPISLYTDGVVSIVSKDASMGRDYGSNYDGYFFRFDARVTADRDFEDCFILFAITPSSGESTYVIREIADINAIGNERILITIPVNPGFGGGKFGYKIYSKGEEIEIIDPEADSFAIQRLDKKSINSEEESRNTREMISTNREIPDTTGTPAKVVKEFLLEFPESLVGVLEGGYAEATFSIGANGRAIEILELVADHPDLVPPALESIVETKYQPGTLNGEPLVTTVSRRFFFNEFASFSEELRLVPYPSFRDREPHPIYFPMPVVEAPIGTIVEVELTVDRLGRPQGPRILESPNEILADKTLELVRTWVFLPGIKDLFPVERQVVVPIRFGQ